MEGHVGDYLQFVSCFVAFESVEIMLKESSKYVSKICGVSVVSKVWQLGMMEGAFAREREPK